MLVRVIRIESGDDGVFGEFLVYDDRQNLVGTFFSVEDDWKNNQNSISCIPDGTYTLVRSVFYKYGYEAFEITKVPQRSRILIHPANTEEDVKGCIGIGMRLGQLRVKVDEDTGEENKLKRAVVASREAFNKFMELMSGVDEATIIIKWAEGLP